MHRRERRVRRNDRVRALLCLGLLGGLATTTSLAAWTDDVDITGASFTAGTLDLTVNNADPYTGATALGMTAMRPGSTSAQVLTVRNAGNVALKYTLVGGLSGANASSYATASALRLTVVLGGTVSGSGTTATCTGGTTLYGPTPLTATASTSLLGARPAATLAPAGTEALCFQISFDSAAPASLQGLPVDAVFTATATSDLS